MIYDEDQPFGGVIGQVSCPPTKEQLRAHYQRCLDACLLEENRQVFRDELTKLDEVIQ